MDRKQLGLVLAILAVVTLVGCVLPWYSAKSEVENALSNVPEAYRGFARGMIERAAKDTTVSGTNSHFKGVFVLILGLIGGAAGLVLFLGKEKQVPLDWRQLFFVSLGAFGLGALLVFLDLVREEGINAFGGWLAFLATLAGAGLAFWGTRGAPMPKAAAPAEGDGGDASGD
jgi:hypothetical protein